MKKAVKVYRIVKHHWRQDDTGEIRTEYQIEEKVLSYTLFGIRIGTKNPRWKAASYRYCNYLDELDAYRNYSTLEEAQEILINLRKEIPPDKILNY